MSQPETIVFLCPICRHFVAELGNFVRARHCGYEFIINRLAPDPTRSTLRPPVDTAARPGV